MMTITLSATGRELRCTFAYHAAIVERIKTIPGAQYDKQSREWTVPAANADRLMDAFPKATFDYDVIAAACDVAAQRDTLFAASLRQWGIELVEDTFGRIVAVGETVSPLIQELVAARPGLRRWATRADPSALRQGVLIDA